MTDNLDDLRRDYAAHGVGGMAIGGLLERLVRATAVQYPPRYYASSGEWSRESLEDVLGSWIESRLLGRGALDQAFATVTDERHLKRWLTTSLRWHLAEVQADQEARRLARRTLTALRADARFVIVGRARTAGDSRWSLSDTRGSDACVNERELRRVAASLPQALALSERLARILSAAATPVPARVLVAAIVYATGLPDPTDTIAFEDDRVDDPEAMGTAEAALELVDQAILHEAATSVLARLEDRHVETIRALAAHDHRVAAAADILGVAETTVRTRMRQVVMLLAHALSEPDPARHTVEAAASVDRVQTAYSCLVEMIEGGPT